MRRFFVILVTVFILSAVSLVYGQDELTEEATSAGSPSNPTQEISIDEANRILEEVRQSASDAHAYAEEAGKATDFASGLLNIFQVVGVLFILGGFFAFGTYQRNLSELRKDKNRIIEDLTKTQNNLEAKRSELEAAQAKLQEAIQLYNEKAKNTSLVLSLLPLGEQQYLVQNYRGARDTYLKASQLDPDNPIAHYLLGYVYLLMEKYEDAKAHLSRALDIDSNFLSAQAALGYVYRRMAENLPLGIEQDHMFVKAEEHLIAALKDSPRLVDLDRQSWWGALGSLYRRRKQYEKALAHYYKAVEVTPYSSYPYGNIARLYLQVKEYDKCLETYEIVEKLATNRMMAEPQNYWWHTDLIAARLALGKDTQDVLESVSKIIPADSNYPLTALIYPLKQLEEGLKSKYPDRATSAQNVIQLLESVLIVRCLIALAG